MRGGEVKFTNAYFRVSSLHFQALFRYVGVKKKKNVLTVRQQSEMTILGGV